jgi:hypothetical protein
MVRSVDLTGPVGRLEALLNEGRPEARCAALVCHPHPLGGGTLHNKVVYHAMKVLNDPAWGFGFPVLRFNFRSTGLSQGQHDGAAETGDVMAALDWLHSRFELPMVVAGFSFGAAMALEACCGSSAASPAVRSVRALAALGLPLEAEGRAYSYPFLDSCTLPKLFISGNRDEYAPADKLAQVVAHAHEPQRLVLISGADHFFTGQVEALQKALAGWLEETLA